MTLTNDLPFDAVERVRAIRDRYYEETKHLTDEERWAFDEKRYTEAKAWMDTIMPDPSRFPFLAGK